MRMAVALKREPSMACFQSSICPAGTMTVLTAHVQKFFRTDAVAAHPGPRAWDKIWKQKSPGMPWATKPSGCLGVGRRRTGRGRRRRDASVLPLVAERRVQWCISMRSPGSGEQDKDAVGVGRAGGEATEVVNISGAGRIGPVSNRDYDGVIGKVPEERGGGPAHPSAAAESPGLG